MWAVCHCYGEAHVIPILDLKDHTATESCWCKPVEDSEQDDLFIHNSMDGREEYEHGRKMH
jgi:hypothetical protein